ncbi:MAG: class I SAM-dependent methyltransferase [Candidatus Omnitrophica bacterium]|nr:class I SAM-dependent methyltransferase [Candidatus Omnitrophota bacterium]
MKKNCPGISPDGPGCFQEPSLIKLTSDDINRCAITLEEDLNRPEVLTARKKLADVKTKMDERNLKYCSAAGTFVKNTYTSYNELKKLWEDTWILAHSDVHKGMKVLDIGGASTPFSFCLADMGCSVRVIDNDWGNCGTVYNGNYVAKQMNWDLETLDWDIGRGLPFENDSFDRVFCVCVIEHLPSVVRQLLMKEIRRVLKPGGIAGLTTDYDHGRKVITTDKGLRFGFKEKFNRDVLEPSGLSLMGNPDLYDFKANENFLGAFFLKKPC